MYVSYDESRRSIISISELSLLFPIFYASFRLCQVISISLQNLANSLAAEDESMDFEMFIRIANVSICEDYGCSYRVTIQLCWLSESSIFLVFFFIFFGLFLVLTPASLVWSRLFDMCLNRITSRSFVLDEVSCWVFLLFSRFYFSNLVICNIPLRNFISAASIFILLLVLITHVLLSYVRAEVYISSNILFITLYILHTCYPFYACPCLC